MKEVKKKTISAFENPVIIPFTFVQMHKIIIPMTISRMSPLCDAVHNCCAKFTPMHLHG